MGQHLDTLTLYFYPSPFGLDWSSPRAIAISSAINAASQKGRHIGHVSIEVIQRDGDQVTRRFHTGMTQLNRREHLPLIFKSGIALGILFFDLKGALEEESKLDLELERRSRQGKLSFLRLTIHRQATERLFKYLQEYREKGCEIHYGLPNRPLYGEGGGCSAFGASFLETVGLLQPEFRAHWTRLIRVPQSLIGAPITKKHVSFARLLLGRTARQWAELTEPHREIFFWDPDLMHRWVNRTWGSGATEYEHIRLNNAKGLYKQAHEIPPPTGPIFLNQKL